MTATAPLWSPGPGYVQALTATVWASPTGGRLTHAVAVTYNHIGQKVVMSGPVTGDNVMRCGGLIDKPHRIRWLAQTPPVMWPAGAAQLALRYHDWLHHTEQGMDDRYQRLLHARHLQANQMRLRATPHGRFQAVTTIEIEPGPYRRFDITAHAAALSALVRRLGPGTQLRFHPAAAAHLTDPLQAHALRQLAPGCA